MSASKQTLVDSLNGVTGDIQLGLQVGEVVVPLVIGAVKSIKSWLDESGNITFTAAVDTGDQDIASGLQSFKSALAAANAELAKDGQPQVPDPTQG